MAFQHSMQTSRFELKYLIDERKARAVKTFIRSHLEADPYTKPGQDFGYEVRSLYLDSPKLVLNVATLEGHKNRFKLRIRFYDDDPDHPAFLEIKRRNTDVILKERAIVSREGVKRILDGAQPDPAFLYKDEPKGRKCLFNFCSLRDQIGAGGSVFVCYLRDAWVPANSDASRLTFDRRIISREYTHGNGLVMPEEFRHTAVKGVTLELKFTDRFPNWMRDLVHNFDLERRSVPKYVECVAAAKNRPNPRLAPYQEIAR